MKKHLILAGAGHAHLTVIQHLQDFREKGHRITVIGPDEFHYYSGMGPGMLAGIYAPEEIRFPVGKMVRARGGIFIRNKVEEVFPDEKKIRLESGEMLSYDVISFNLGSRISWDRKDMGANVFPVKPIENLLCARQKILSGLKEKKMKICIAGGGAAGAEIAAGIRRLVQDEKGDAEITLLAGKRLVPTFHPKVRTLLLDKLEKLGIAVKEGIRLKQIRRGNAELSDGSVPEEDLLFLAVGTVPPSVFRNSGLSAGKDGGLTVNSFLQSNEHSEIFGGGDCIDFAPRALPRVGVYAVRQNPVLLHNIRAAMEGNSRFRTFRPQNNFMLILSMGDGSGIFYRKSIVLSGKAAFWLKDYIDRRFMRSFL